jgi:hypothetical protein
MPFQSTLSSWLVVPLAQCITLESSTKTVTEARGVGTERRRSTIDSFARRRMRIATGQGGESAHWPVLCRSAPPLHRHLRGPDQQRPHAGPHLDSATSFLAAEV